MKVLFVCLGNICRSPTAEAVLRDLVAGTDVVVHSAGTGGWHIGEPRDARSTAAAARRDITLDGVGRQVARSDFEEYDLLIAMDRSNARDLLALAPAGTAHKVRLLREWDPDAHGDLDVPDPYYGDGSGFDTVLDIVERSCAGLIEDLR